MSTNDITIISSAYHNISKYYAIINNVWIPTSRYSVVFKWLFYEKKSLFNESKSFVVESSHS